MRTRAALLGEDHEVEEHLVAEALVVLHVVVHPDVALPVVAHRASFQVVETHLVV